MKQLTREARLAGLWYLFMAITGMIGLLYVPSQIMVQDDFTATLANIREREGLFRGGIMANILCQTSFILVALHFRRLFKEVSDYWSKLLLLLVTASVPVAVFTTIISAGALYCSRPEAFLSGFDAVQLNSLAMLFLKINEFGISAVEIFWGLWLFPLGVLFIKAPFMPGAIGYLLLVNSAAYLLEWILKCTASQYYGPIADFLMIPMSVGEFAALLWLLIMGVKRN